MSVRNAAVRCVLLHPAAAAWRLLHGWGTGLSLAKTRVWGVCACGTGTGICQKQTERIHRTNAGTSVGEAAGRTLEWDSSESHVGSLIVIVSPPPLRHAKGLQSATGRPWFCFTQHCGSPASEQGTDEQVSGVFSELKPPLARRLLLCFQQPYSSLLHLPGGAGAQRNGQTPSRCCLLFNLRRWAGSDCVTLRRAGEAL